MQHCGKLMLVALRRNILCNGIHRVFQPQFSLLSNVPQRSLNFPSNLSVSRIVKSIKNDRNTLKELPDLLPKIDFTSVTSEEATDLLKCCGREAASVSNDIRYQTCQQIYQYLIKCKKLDLELFHTYIKVCTDNLQPVDYKQCLKSLNLQPTNETYKLLLHNVSEQGDVSQVYDILEIMKNRQIPVDGEVFTSLVLCHALQGGFNAAEPILQTMKSAHIPETNSTILSLFKGLLRTKNYEDFKTCLQKYAIRLSDQEFLLMLEYVGLTGNVDIYKEVKVMFNNIIPTHELQVKIEDVCFHLIHMGQVETAMNIYKDWVTFEVEEVYGEALFKEMIHCDTDIHQIISLAKQIREDHQNEFILENLTGFALQNNYVEKCYELFKHITVRCHYFWPLLLSAGKSDSEKGISTVLKKMKDFNIKPDAETFEWYIFPFCNLENLNLLISRFQHKGFTVKEIVSPLIIFLLRKNLIKPAFEIFTSSEVVSSLSFVGVLARSWKSTMDSKTIVKFLEKYRETQSSDSNFIQHFLIKALGMCKSEIDYQNFLKLIEIIKSENFRINFSTANNIIQLLQKCPNELKNRLKQVTNSMLEVGDHMHVEETAIPHPRRMSTPDLECHLIELEEKNMETRGVIRRLIQAHSREGNINRVAELRTKLQDLGYKESPGMKSLIMHNYTMAGQLEEALRALDEIKQDSPNFVIDSYKCIDLARLMTENQRFEDAVSFLQEEGTKFTRINTDAILRNCRELLMACKKEEQQIQMFELLLKIGLCKPSNVILGPLIKTLLDRNEIPAAVEKYIEFAQKYNCTPLQRVLLSAVTKSENPELLEKVLKATQEVHGTGPTQVGLIAALAESNQVKPLKKVLIQTNEIIHPLLKRQYERWVEENKIEPLLAISKASQRLPMDVASLEFVYKCILDIYGSQNDCESALSFYENLPDENKPELEKKVLGLLRKNNRRLPKTREL